MTDVGDLYALGIRLTPGGPPFVITSVRGVLVENKNQCLSSVCCLLRRKSVLHALIVRIEPPWIHAAVALDVVIRA